MTGSGSVGYEINDRHIARITLDRPERRNAQDVEMTYELNEKFDRAARDPDVRVIVLDANGPHFSAGHDLRDPNWPTPEQAIGVACGFGADGTEGWVAREERSTSRCAGAGATYRSRRSQPSTDGSSAAA